MQRVLTILLRIFGGFELAVATLFFMTLATWLGTLNQVDEGLFRSQVRYFESWFYIERVGPFGFPLPGGALLMVVLMTNLVVGGILRLRKGASTIGILITHVGILFLLSSGVVKYFSSTEGNLLLWPGDEGSHFSSFHFWEVEVVEDLGGGKQRRFVIPHDDVVACDGEAGRSFKSESWPFTLVLDHFSHNVDVAMARGHGDAASAGVVIGDLRLVPQDRELQEELNFAGLRLRMRGQGGSEVGTALLHGLMDHPHVFEVDGRRFGVRLQRERELLPFSVRLDEFHHEVYPNTMQAKVFASDVTVRAGDEVRTAKIEMNQPLRRDGYILFQASYGPEGARPGDRKYSVFQVVRNPSDQWPLWACIVIGLGLSFHFGSRLVRWMHSERKRNERAAIAAATAPESTQELVEARS